MARYAIGEEGALLRVEDGEDLPSSAHAVEGFAFTTAPEAYDYWYTHTVSRSGGAWRLVAYTDADRFRDFQGPRYASGFWVVFDAADVKRRESFGLPTVRDALAKNGGW